MKRSWSRPGLAHLVFFLSGGAGLAYQVIWTRLLTTGLGHETPSLLAVMAAVLCGMALGARALDDRVSRSRQPARWYAALELIIGGWAAVTAWLLPVLNRVAVEWLGLDPAPARHAAVAFGLTWLALLPATAALGATLPAMDRVAAGLSDRWRCVGGLYAVNTAGAVAGVLVAATVLMPRLGLRASVFVLAGVNLVCALLALALRRPGPEPAGTAAARAGRESGVESGLGPGRLAVVLGATGLLGIGFEAVGVRVLAQVLEGTVYTFAAVLAVYLLGTAIGAALYQRFAPDAPSPRLLTDLLGVCALACGAGLCAAGQAPLLLDAGRRVFGTGPFGAALAEALTAAAVFLLPTIGMGATFSHLAQSARGPGGGVGRALAWNTLGGALAPVVFGLGLLPLLGARWALAVIALGYAALRPSARAGRWLWTAGAAALALGVPVNLRILDLPARATVAAWREGLLGTVAVIRESDGQRLLRVDNRFQMGGTASADTEARHFHLPLLLHPAPRRALLLGVGTGITFGAASLHPGLVADGVELVPEVAAVMPQFEPENRAPTRQPGMRLQVCDARRFVLASPGSYDVIVADLFHPARDGAALLYTREHFAAIRARLVPGGRFWQWLPVHQFDDAMLRVVLRTFLGVYPDAEAWLLRYNVDAPVVGLVGSAGPTRSGLDPLGDRLAHPALAAELKRLGLADPLRLAGHWVADAAALARFAADGPRNTDDRPVILFGAPRLARGGAGPPYERLTRLLAAGADAVPAWLAAADPALGARWRAYRAARDAYLRGLVHDLEQRREPAVAAYVESAALSADFTPGYAQCLTLASLLAPSQPDAARALLQRLVDVRPEIPVAARMLERLWPAAGESHRVTE